MDYDIKLEDAEDKGPEVPENTYDISLFSIDESDSDRYRRSNRRTDLRTHSRAGFGLPFIWKTVIVILLISTIGLWYMVKDISKQLYSINEALGQPQAASGSLLLGKGLPAMEEEPTEEDSIRQWESEQAQNEQSPEVVSGIRKVYLTFDDGPSRYTDEILDILKEYGVKATFFVVAQGKDVFSDEFRRIVEEGHTLGMHSYTHVYKDIYSSREAFIQDLNKLMDYIHDKTGVYPDFYRFPGGSSTGLGAVSVKELEDYLKEIGVEWFDWNISSGDATGKLSADKIFKNSTEKLDNYSEAVILFHDAADKKTTVEALPRIIEYILGMEDTVIVPITRTTLPVKHK